MTEALAGFPETPYSLHPYQYGYSNPILYTDPSGAKVDEGGIGEGRYFYTCNCGWLDTGHLGTSVALAVLEQVDKAESYFAQPDCEKEYYIIPAGRISQSIGTARFRMKTNRYDVAIPRGAIQSQTDKDQIAMGIYRFISEVHEDTLIQRAVSHYSQEDLTSNLISFYAAKHDPPFEKINTEEYHKWLAPICGYSPDEKERKKVSREVFEKKIDTGDTPIFEWECPRLVRHPTVASLCGSYTSGVRKWPAAFSRIQPVRGGWTRFDPGLGLRRSPSDAAWYAIDPDSFVQPSWPPPP
ncbi:MAG: hypothetical protein MI924_05050 [Chloroflexales bacterium]|nr:hypothetical protein [Chloroflexales bacterium]